LPLIKESRAFIDRIKTGMSQIQVAEAVGQPTSIDPDDQRKGTFSWDYVDIEGSELARSDRLITVFFEDYKVERVVQIAP